MGKILGAEDLHWISKIMPLKAFMEADIYSFLAREILLYLPLIDLLECKRVSHAWKSQVRALFGNEWTQWANVHLAQKMSAAVSSVEAGTVVHKVHLNSKYEELIKQGYKLSRCYLFNGCICLQFSKIIPNSNIRKYAFCAISQGNINEVKYLFVFEGTRGYHFPLDDSIVMWWYVLESDNNLKLSFKVVSGMPISFSEKTYNNTLPSSDFLSPITAYYEIISGDSSLRSEIQNQFPELNFHAQYFQPANAMATAARFYNHEIFYYQRLSHEISTIWVLDTNNMKVKFKRNTTKSDWICHEEDFERILLSFYRHPFATFFIKLSHTFAVWDLSQPGHPRHISFDIQLPMEPWLSTESDVTRSKWIIMINSADKSNYIYVDLPSKHILKNSSVLCKCNNKSQPCYLEENSLKLKASQSSHTPKTFAHFIGERFIIEETMQPPKTNLRDCWNN